MPVGGRVNRRDNLRSKKVLSKTKPTKDINAKSTKEAPSDLSHLDILKPKETKTTDKSEVIIENLRDYYVRLEDLRLNKINDNEDDNETNSKNLNVTLNVTNASVLETPRKRGRVPKKKEEPEPMEVEEVKPKILINESVSDTPRKRGRQPKKREESEIFESIMETENSVAIENKSVAVKVTGKKGRPPKIVEDILEIDEEVKETVVVEVDLEKKKLGRRNAFQRAIKESSNVEKVIEEKVDEDQPIGRSKSSGVAVSVLENTDKKDLKPAVAIVVNNAGDAIKVDDEPQMTKPRVRNPRANEEHNKVENTVRRTKSKLSKQQKPFVIEKEEDGEPAQVKQTKIPGLVMLDNIKSRKSELLSMKAKETLPEENMAKKPPVAPKKTEKPKPVEPTVEQTAVQEKVPGLKMTADIKRRKSELLGKLNDGTLNVPKLPSVRQSVSMKEKPEVVENGKEIKKMESKVPVQEPKKKEVSESTKEIKTTEVVSLKEIKKCAEVVVTIKESKKPEVNVSVKESDQQTNTRQRVSIFSSTPKKSFGKEETKPITPVQSVKVPSRSNSPCPVASTEKIPGLSMMKTGSFKRSNIDSPMPQAVKRSRISVALPVSDKVPGLSTTDQIRKQKIDVQVQKEEQKKQDEHKRKEDELKKKADEQKRIIEDQKRQLEAQRQALEQERKKKEEQRKAESFQQMFTNEYKRVSAAINPPANVANTSRLSMSSSLLKSPSVKVPTVSILAKPSPFKRPMSCLDDPEDEDDIVENRPKVSRVQQDRRQSVTFNREVEVKEIHGNSFNSDASMTSVSNDDDFEKRVQEELERTKHRIADKRFGFNKSVNLSFSTDSSVPTFSKPEVRPLTKKTSNLSELISTRVKVHSPPRISISSRPMSSQQQPESYSRPPPVPSDVQSSGALRKLTSQGPSASSRDWKSYRHITTECEDNDNSNEQLNSSQMSNDEDDSSNKGKCSIM